MRFFHSQKTFERYKPHKSRWQEFLENRKKQKTVKPTALLPEFKNPYQRQEPIKEDEGSKKIIIIAWLLFLFAWIAILIYLPYFRVKKITFSGNRVIKNEEIQAIINQTDIHRTKIWPRDNYFAISEKNITEPLQKTFDFEKIEVKKVFPHELQLIIYEKQASLILDTGAEYLLVSTQGKTMRSIPHQDNIATATILEVELNSSTTTLSSASSTENRYSPDIKKIKLDIGNLPIVYSAYISDTQNPLEKEFVELINKWHEAILEQQGIGRVRYYELLDQNLTLKIYWDQNWYALTNIHGDIAEQIKNIKIILANNFPQEYINVRFGEKVFWK